MTDIALHGRRRLIRRPAGPGTGRGPKSQRLNARGDVWCYECSPRYGYQPRSSFRTRADTGKPQSYCRPCAVTIRTRQDAKSATFPERYERYKARLRTQRQAARAKERVQRRLLADRFLSLVPARAPTYAALARAAGLTPTALWRWRHMPETVPDRPSVRRIVDALAVLAPELLP